MADILEMGFREAQEMQSQVKRGIMYIKYITYCFSAQQTWQARGLNTCALLFTAFTCP